MIDCDDKVDDVSTRLKARTAPETLECARRSDPSIVTKTDSNHTEDR